jgi:hypothetical protein
LRCKGLHFLIQLFPLDGENVASTISGGPESLWTSIFAALYLLYSFTKLFVVKMWSSPEPSDRYQCHD